MRGENHARFVETTTQRARNEIDDDDGEPDTGSRSGSHEDEHDGGGGFGQTIAPQLDWLGTVKHGGQSLPIRHRKAEPPAGGRPGQRWVASDRPDRNSRTRTAPRTPRARSGGAMPSRGSCRKINRWGRQCAELCEEGERDRLGLRVEHYRARIGRLGLLLKLEI